MTETIHADCNRCGRETRHSPDPETSSLTGFDVIRCNACGQTQPRAAA